MNLTLSCEPHDGLLTAARWILVGILTVALAALARAGAGRMMALAGAAAGSLAASVALWQGVAGFSLMAERLADAPLPMREAALARLSSGRVNGPFLLPASLAGALGVTLPLTIALAVVSRSRRERVVHGGLVLLQGAALLWTLSLGGWTALGLSAAVVLSSGLVRSRPGRRRLAIGAVLGAGIVVGGVLVRLMVLPPPGPPDRPLTYRAGNLQVAARIFADHPLLGTGLGTFGDVFPGYRREGMNETRYAHCTWLQIPAEMGFAVVPPLILALLGAFVLVRRVQGRGALEKAAAIGALGFLVHNAVDFTAYQPSVGALFALALALSTSGRLSSASSSPAIVPPRVSPPVDASAKLGAALRVQEESSEADEIAAIGERVEGNGLSESGPLQGRSFWTMDRTAWIGALAASAAAALVLCSSGLSDLATDRAAEAHGRDTDAETRALNLARLLDPLDAGPRGNLALLLAQPARASVQDLERAESEARSAIALDSRTAFRHRDLAWILVKEGRTAEAWVEISRAVALYPLKGEYREDLERLQEHLFTKKDRADAGVTDRNPRDAVVPATSVFGDAGRPGAGRTVRAAVQAPRDSGR